MPQGLHLVSDNRSAIVRLLVVSREPAVLGPLWAMGESDRWQVESATNGWGAMERVQSGITPDVLILDVPASDKDGLHFLRWLRRLRPELPILVLYDPADTLTQQEAMRLGARDYIAKPVQDQVLENAVRRQLSKSADDGEGEITSDDVAQLDNSFFVAASPVMRKLRAQVELLAETESPVLIVGEAGCGKEMTARLMHQLSARSGFKFAKVNCAALPSDLLEVELFGSDRNGTAGYHVKPGKIELCEKGTILLEEIAEMPMSLQHKLLQAMQSKTFARPGSGATVHFDIRILTACPTDFESAVFDNRLLGDLCYRLSTYTVRVPPLRERREDLSLLLHYFMRDLAKQYALSPRTFSPAILEACQSYHWPGNLHELENFVKRLLLATGTEPQFGNDEDNPGGGEKTELSTSNAQCGARISGRLSATCGSESLKSLVQTVKLEAEKNAIAAALERTRWNRKGAARLLKVSYRSLLYKIDQYQMKAPGSVPVPAGAGLRPNRNALGGNERCL